MSMTPSEESREVFIWIKSLLTSLQDNDGWKNGSSTGVRFSTMSVYTIRPHLRSIYTLFLFLNTAVFAAGLALNVFLIFRIIKRRLYHDHIMLYLTNAAVADIITLSFVLPYSLCISLFKTWFLGQALCYTGPWIQHLPNVISVLTYLLLALHRYRQIMCPLKEPLPIWLCLLAIWIVAVCVNLPISIFHRYIDIEAFWGSHENRAPLKIPPRFFRGVSMCVQSIKQSLKDLSRATFIILFAFPFVVIIFLYVRSSTELSASLNRRLEYAESLEEMEAIAPLANAVREGSDVEGDQENDYRRKSSTRTKSQALSTSNFHGVSLGGNRGSQVEEEAQSDACPPVYTNVETSARLTRERNIQNCLILITFVYMIGWSPLKILVTSNPLLILYDNSSINVRQDVEKKLDITYLVFIFFTHLITFLNPVVIIKRLPYGTDTTVENRLMRPMDMEMRPANNSASTSTDDQPRASLQKKRQSNTTASTHRSSMEKKRPRSTNHSKANVNEHQNNLDNAFGGLEVL